MNTPPASPFHAPSPKRRAMLAGLGAGICAAVVTAVRWPRTEAATADAKRPTPPAHPLKAEPVTEHEPATTEPVIPTQLSREWFLPHLRSMFQVTDYPALRLIEISPASSLANGAISYTAFTLLFEAPTTCTTPEGIHRLRHDSLGEMDLFLSPVGRPGERVCYEAAFTLRS